MAAGGNPNIRIGDDAKSYHFAHLEALKREATAQCRRLKVREIRTSAELEVLLAQLPPKDRIRPREILLSQGLPFKVD